MRRAATEKIHQQRVKIARGGGGEEKFVGCRRIFRGGGGRGLQIWEDGVCKGLDIIEQMEMVYEEGRQKGGDTRGWERERMREEEKFCGIEGYNWGKGCAKR